MNSSFFSNKPIIILSGISLCFIFAGVFYVLLSVGSLPENIALQTNAIGEVVLFGTISDIWWIWGMGGMFVALNIFLGNTFYYKERVISYIFLGVNPIVALLSFLVIANIISMN